MRVRDFAIFLLGVGFSSSAVLFAQNNSQRMLEPPPIAKTDSASVEILTVWAVPGKAQQFTIKTTYKDPAAWGVVLVDIARHVSRAYSAEGRDEKNTMERIRTAFEAEWSHPTDAPKTIK
ncbi:MAG TPA: DUF5076 domain-containing protein [Candidatus Binatia bacterium]|jgi:hypothetical protein